MLNAVGLLRSVPVMVTRVPTLPLTGLIEVIAGGGNSAAVAKTLGYVHITKRRAIKIWLMVVVFIQLGGLVVLLKN